MEVSTKRKLKLIGSVSGLASVATGGSQLADINPLIAVQDPMQTTINYNYTGDLFTESNYISYTDAEGNKQQVYMGDLNSTSRVFTSSNSAQQTAASALAISDDMKDFEEASKSIDEAAIAKEGIEKLVNDARNKITNYLIDNSTKLDGDDKSYLERYDTRQEINELFENVKNLGILYERYWENQEFESNLRELISNYNTLAELNLNMSNTQDANAISENAEDKMELTSEDIYSNPTSEERTELSDTFIRGLPDEVWKISGLVGLGALAGAIALGLGIGEGVKKGKRKSLITSETKYFMGEDNPNIFKNLSLVSSEINKTINKIEHYKLLANKAKGKNKTKFLEIAKLSENSRYYLDLKDKKNKLVSDINRGIDISTDMKKLHYLNRYAVNSKAVVKVPEAKYAKLGKSLLRDIEKYDKLDKSIINQTKKESEFRLTSKQKRLKKIKEELLIKVDNINLTGPQKVSFNNFSNNISTLFSKENLSDLKKFAYGLKKTNNDVFKKSMELLSKMAKSEILDIKGDNSKSYKVKLSAKTLQDKIKKSRPNIDSYYYGYVNNIKNIPVNPNRFICYDKSIESKDINLFFDKITRSYVQKDKKMYELTLSYLQNNKEKSFVCSYDNQDAIDLMKAKFLTSIPQCSKVEIVEKTISLNGKVNVTKKDYNIEDTSSGFRQAVLEANLAISNFNKVLEIRKVIKEPSNPDSIERVAETENGSPRILNSQMEQ